MKHQQVQLANKTDQTVSCFFIYFFNYLVTTITMTKSRLKLNKNGFWKYKVRLNELLFYQQYSAKKLQINYEFII